MWRGIGGIGIAECAARIQPTVFNALGPRVMALLRMPLLPCRAARQAALAGCRGIFSNASTWTSLTSIATEITGTHQSGPRFFGIAR